MGPCSADIARVHAADSPSVGTTLFFNLAASMSSVDHRLQAGGYSAPVRGEEYSLGGKNLCVRARVARRQGGREEHVAQASQPVAAVDAFMARTLLILQSRAGEIDRWRMPCRSLTRF